MPDKIVHLPRSKSGYPAILVSTLRELLDMPCKIVYPPSSNPAYPAILVSTLTELLVMPCKIVCPLTSYLAYSAILIPEAIKPERAISYAMQNCMPTDQSFCVPGDTLMQ